MKADQASATARVIAASTVLLDADPRTRPLVAAGAAELCDALLRSTWRDRLLARSARNPLGRWLWRRLEAWTHPGIMAHYWHRKAWIEQQVRAAIEAGARRLIVLGAGLDTLGLRLSRDFPALVVVEIDHPATQGAKRAALAHASIQTQVQFLPLDLLHADLPASLADDPAQTVVAAEGLLMYLPQPRVHQLLTRLAGFDCDRLQILFSSMSRWPDGGSGFRPRSRLIETWLRWRGEPFDWCIAPDQLEAFVQSCGWQLQTLVHGRELGGGQRLDGENMAECERVRDES